jgi:zinc protease
MRHPFGIVVVVALYVAATTARAELDLRNASVNRLDNGLTYILLQDSNFPVVSVQSLYRVGARDESTGYTGLAHFLEHMAFRSTVSFPDTGVVSEIYARGGEWHGYTWVDQTTYFATVPKDDLDLLLRIEAERMSALVIDPEDMEAERGAVLAEMHGYENSPSTVLFDAVLFTSFLGHPYRNNTIGWESDIENLRHEDVVAFYERHYVPANAVIAIVGDFDSSDVKQRVGDLFGDIEAAPATPLPHTIEPPQTGERRVRLSGPGERKYFKIAWHAPAASSPDYAAFVILQDLLGGSSGVSFLQNDWGTPVRDGSLLQFVADDITTWYPPSAQDYVFLVSGSTAADADESAVEAEIETRLAIARETPPDKAELAASVARILDELVFDVETTEDAAHQLAFFDGLGALDVLLQLPQRLQAVTPGDVLQVARRYLRPEQRTIGWWVPGNTQVADSAVLPDRELPAAAANSDVDAIPVAPPLVLRLDDGIPLIVARSDLSSSAFLSIVMQHPDGMRPALGYRSLDYRVRPAEFAEAVRESVAASGEFSCDRSGVLSSDPELRLEQVMREIIDIDDRCNERRPSVIVVAGGVETEAELELLNEAFDTLPPESPTLTEREWRNVSDRSVSMGRPIAQAQLGYLFQVPPPKDPDADAWRLMLYILSHAYEGRLGKKAISDRGLVYYIDSHYRSNGRDAWITMTTGVDPPKLQSLESLFRAELERLALEPPTDAEISEARRHLVGRARSAAQSNEELSAELARQWIWYGRLQSPEELQAALDAVSNDQVRATATAFASGTMITVTD